MAIDFDHNYSILDACKVLNISFHKMYEWVRQGKINGENKPFRSKRKTFVIPQTEIDRLKPLLNPPSDCLTITQFAKLNKFSRNMVINRIQKLNLKPVLQHVQDQISPQNSYYHFNDLKKINEDLFANSKAVQKYQLPLTTDQVFDPKIDISSNQLQAQLDQRYPLGRRMIIDWIRHGYLQHHYQIDHNGKLFFTPDDVRWIKQQYRNMPANITYNNRQLAEQLHAFPSQIQTFRNYYHFPVIKILGYKGVFYTDEIADQIIDWYQHPKHRPYPYHPHGQNQSSKGSH